MKLMRGGLLCVLMCCGAISVGSDVELASAQVAEEEILRGIDIARKSGATISDEEAGRIIATFREQGKRTSQMYEELQWQKVGPTTDLEHPASHIKGKDGIPFPKSEEVVFKPSPTETPGPEGAMTPAPVWSPAPYVRPTKCEKNETRRVEHNPDGNEAIAYLDYLFVSEDLVPIDVSEVYGAKTSLIPYGPHEEKATLIRMEIYGVPCVPYRMRTTGKADYFDTGLNALRNYDSNPAGKGVVHPFVNQKLYPEKFERRESTRPRRQ